MEKILFTGSRGFFGSRFIEDYKRQFDILATNSDTLDITDRERVVETIESFRPDYVIHAAAIAVTDYCNSNPEICRLTNISGSGNIASACRITGSKLIFLSTEQVFNGNKESGPYKETDTPLPDTEYGKNKLEAEKLITEICNDYVIIRLTWLFGIPGKSKPVSGNILWDSIRKIMTGKPFNVPANEYRGMTSIDELLARFPSLFNLAPGIYHTGSENPMSRYETVCHIFKELGLQDRTGELVIKDEETYRQNPRDARLDTGRLKSSGISFSETPEALSSYIKNNHLSV